jgi:hypothetical protein
MNFFASHNKDGNNTGLADLNDQTPSGNEAEREHTFGISLGGNYILPQRVSWCKINVWTSLAYIVKKNKLMISAEETGENITYHKEGAAQDFQVTVGMGISF